MEISLLDAKGNEVSERSSYRDGEYTSIIVKDHNFTLATGVAIWHEGELLGTFSLDPDGVPIASIFPTALMDTINIPPLRLTPC